MASSSELFCKPTELNGDSPASRAAALLMQCRMSGVRVPRFPPELSPQDLDQGYAIQGEVARQRGAPPGGFKIGLTSESAQRANGSVMPIVGRLASTDIRRRPGRLLLPRSHLRIVEPEVALEIGRDLDHLQAPFSEAMISSIVRAAYAALEICDARLDDEERLAALVADNSNADLLVLGDEISEWQAADFAQWPVHIRVGDAVSRVGSPSQALGHPLKALTWLANWLAARGESLRAGFIVATGSCTEFVSAAPRDVIQANFGTQARVSIEFQPRRREVNL